VKSHGLALDDIDLVIFHQANYHLIHLMMEQLGLPAEKTLTTVQRFGNTSGSGVPIALRAALDENRVKPGDNVVLVSFGAGMSHGGTVLRWPDKHDYVQPW
jgi:3-oxoacyl-[acyl-carrier-protein] synthase III